MSIPNTTTFSLQDVRDELNLGSTTSLIECFNSAVPQHFDPTYEGSKNSLLNFRNYGVIPTLKAISIYGYNSLLRDFACAGNIPSTKYTAASNGSLEAVLSNPLYNDISGSSVVDSGWYAVQDVLFPSVIQVRFWNGLQWNGSIQNC